MNKNYIVSFETEKAKGLFVSVPYIYKNFKIVQYAKAGTHIMETDSTGLNHWKSKIPSGSYDFIGRSNELSKDIIDLVLGISFEQYIDVLDENDISVNLSDSSNFCAVLVCKD